MNKIRVAYVIKGLPPGTGAGLRIMRLCERGDIESVIPFIITSNFSRKNFLDYQSKTKEFDFSEDIFKGLFIPYEIRKSKFLKILSYFYKHIVVFFQVFIYLINNRKKFDIIHIVGSSEIAYNSILVSKFLKKKIIDEVTLSNEPPIMDDNCSWGKKIIIKYEQWIYKKVDLFIVLSKALESELKSLGIKNEKIHIIENPVDRSIFYKYDNDKIYYLKKKFKLTSYSPIFVFIGALNYRKGTDILNSLIHEISKIYQSSAFLILGENNRTIEQIHYQNLLNQTAKKNKTNVFILGLVNNVNDYLNIADYLLFPSRKEGLPNAVLEAMAVGLPVLMNKIPGISNFIINHSENGFIINNNLIPCYLNTIKILENNKCFYNMISKNSIITIKSKFNLKNRDTKLNNLYNQNILI